MQGFGRSCHKWLIGKDLEGGGRGLCGGTTQHSSRGTEEKQENISLFSNTAEIRTGIKL